MKKTIKIMIILQMQSIVQTNLLLINVEKSSFINELNSILFNNLNNVLQLRIKGINLKKANIIFFILLFSSNSFLIPGICDNVSAKSSVSFNTRDNLKSRISNTNSIFEIEIGSDKNLTDYGFPGEGTFENPYRIENYGIDTNMHSAITVYNTTKYIVIQNCTIDSAHSGLVLVEVESGTIKIQNNSFIDNVVGLYLFKCDEIIIFDNLFEQNYESIQIGNTTGIDILHNTFRNNEYGIRSYSLPGDNVFTNIANNYFYENFHAIACSSDLNDFNIHNNSLLNNEYCIFISNYYELNGIYNNITYNLIENSTSVAIRIINGLETTIHHNTFANNNLNAKATSQAFYEGYEKVVWYDKETREGNYWSDWNGILSYKIDGKAKGRDRYPLTKPVHEVQTEIPKFFVGRVVINATIIPLTVIGIGVMIYIYVKKKQKGIEV